MPVIKVLIKGLNKIIEFPTNTPMPDIERHIQGNWSSVEEMSGLPMDQASRMERAEYLGFNVDQTFTHGSPDEIIDEIKKGNGDPFNKFDGLFASEGDISEYGGKFQHSLVARQPVADAGDVDLDYDKSIDFIKKEFPDADEDEIEDLYSIIAEDKNVFDMSSNPLERHGFDDLGEASWEGQRLRGQMANEQGFDAISMSDEFGESFLVPAGSKARNIKAAFNPANKDSANLLAGGAAAAVGIASLSPEEAQAQTSAQKSFINSMLSDNSLESLPSFTTAAAPGIDQQKLPQQFRADVGGFQAPALPRVNQFGQAISGFELPLIGNPVEGVADYLQNFGYDDPATERLKRAAMAGLDVI
jgi:hypothetical protein